MNVDVLKAMYAAITPTENKAPMVSMPPKMRRRMIRPVTALNHTALTGVSLLWIDLAPPFRTGEDSVTSVGEWNTRSRRKDKSAFAENAEQASGMVLEVLEGMHCVLGLLEGVSRLMAVENCAPKDRRRWVVCSDAEVVLKVVEVVLTVLEVLKACAVCRSWKV